jgi:hypothetical protein
VVGSGVLLGHAEAAQLVFEAVAALGAVQAAAGEPGGEDHAVVGQRGGGNPVCGNGFAEGGQHDGSGDPVMGGDREGEPGVVVEPGQDFGVRPGTAVGSSESTVGEVGLPGLVGLLGLEPDVGGLGSLLRLRHHQPVLGQVAGHGGSGHGGLVVVLQVPDEGVRAGVQAGRVELLA